MTDDRWKRNPWDDDPASGGQQKDQEDAADRTTIRPRGGWEPDGAAPSPEQPQPPQRSAGTPGEEAGPDQGIWGTPVPSGPEAPAGSAPSGVAGWENSSYGQQSWGSAPGQGPSTGQPAPAGPPSAGQPPSWQTDETAALGDPYAGVHAQQWPQAGQAGDWQQPGYPPPPGNQPAASQPSAQPGPGRYGADPYGQVGGAQPSPGYGQQPNDPYGQPVGGGYGGPPGGFPPAPPNQPAAPREPGFFANLFDLTFTRFVTPTIIKVVYILLIALVAVWYLGVVIAGFVSETPIVGVVALLLGWIPALLAIAISRMQFEYIVALIRTSEYSRDLRNHFIEKKD